MVLSFIVIVIVAGLVNTMLNSNTNMDPISFAVVSLEEVYA